MPRKGSTVQSLIRRLPSHLRPPAEMDILMADLGPDVLPAALLSVQHRRRRVLVVTARAVAYATRLVLQQPSWSAVTADDAPALCMYVYTYWPLAQAHESDIDL